LGHKWKTLERVDNPDKVEIISPKISNITWEDLSNNEVIREIIYQKIDIEKPKKIVTEYRIQIKKDSKWNLIKPEWLEDILWKWYNNTFYGENLRSFILFLENEHSVSIERISQICFDIFWIKIKNQTVKNISKLAFFLKEEKEMEEIKKREMKDLNEKKTRWRKKQSKWKNLLDRLEKHKDWVLLFMSDFDVPFTNNLAERDLRPYKVKLKVSWCFRSNLWAKYYCRIKSYISTMKKNWYNVFDSLKNIFTNNIIYPNFNG